MVFFRWKWFYTVGNDEVGRKKDACDIKTLLCTEVRGDLETDVF